MSNIASKTERKAIKVIANTLRFFKDTNLLFVSAEDAFAIRHAELCFGQSSKATGIKTTIKKEKEPKF